MKTHIDNTIPNKETGRLNLVNRKMDNDIYKIIGENEGGEISEFVVGLKKYILAEKEKYADERVSEIKDVIREYFRGLIVIANPQKTLTGILDAIDNGYTSPLDQNTESSKENKE